MKEFIRESVDEKMKCEEEYVFLITSCFIEKKPSLNKRSRTSIVVEGNICAVVRCTDIQHINCILTIYY